MIFTSALTSGLFADPGTPHCNGDPVMNDAVCEPEISGGAVCTEQPCDGWFKPDCDCYETDWGDPPPQP